jgi:hypothetical protein
MKALFTSLFTMASPGSVARRARIKRALFAARAVLDVEQRPSRVAPGGQQRGDLALGLGVVALAPARIEKALLDVDDDERGVGEGVHVGPFMKNHMVAAAPLRRYRNAG